MRRWLLGEFLPEKVEQVEQVHQGAQVPPQGDQVPIVGGGNEVSAVPPVIANGEIREALLTPARAMTTQVNKDIGPRMNSMTSRLRDFVRMNPLISLVLRWEKIPKISWMRCIR